MGHNNTSQVKSKSPQINSRAPEGKIKLKDRRMIKLKIERRKASDKNMKFDRTAPSAMRPFKKNASTPTKVIY